MIFVVLHALHSVLFKKILHLLFIVYSKAPSNPAATRGITYLYMFSLLGKRIVAFRNMKQFFFPEGEKHETDGEALTCNWAIQKATKGRSHIECVDDGG